MSGQPKRLMVMAGGTGGHVFPGLAVAHHLMAQGWQVRWLGTADRMEADLVPKHGIEIDFIRISGLRGKGVNALLAAPVRIFNAWRQARAIMKQFKPDVVLGMGGYVTFPGGLVAALRGIPLVVHEQNSVAGLANRVLAKIATRTLCGFPDVLPRGIWTGNPVRREITVLPAPTFRYAERTGPLNVLVVGGSLGAQVLNDVVPKAWALMAESERPNVVHQAGEKNLAQLQALYAAAGVHANCVAFIADMAGAYLWADLVICRAGALTVAELAAAGVASVLVPYPSAVDDHQTGNAQFLAQAGAAVLLPQSELTAERLTTICHAPRSQWAQMAEKAHALARPQATSDVAQHCADLAQ